MIDKKHIEKIAKLARMNITDSEANEYSNQLSAALKYFEQISIVNTDNIEPLITPSSIEAFWREDLVVQDYTAEEMLMNAPEKTGNLFKVPPVI